jgi:hypothetical protein
MRRVDAPKLPHNYITTIFECVMQLNWKVSPRVIFYGRLFILRFDIWDGDYLRTRRGDDVLVSCALLLRLLWGHTMVEIEMGLGFSECPGCGVDLAGCLWRREGRGGGGGAGQTEVD